jgi:hypothetical protein
MKQQVYTVRQGTNLLDLMDKVNSDLRAGWRAQGGLCVTVMPPSSPMFLYTQTLVMETEIGDSQL